MLFDLLMQPLELIYCAIYIYYYVGWSVLAGLALWLFRIGFMKLFKPGRVAHNEKMRELQDQRIQKTTESFMNIKMLKLYGWEGKFSE